MRYAEGQNTSNFRMKAELRGYFQNTNPVSAYPAAGLDIPFYILGSSTESAYLAAELGLPYAFASHFAPRMMMEAVEIYRRYFKPSDYLAKPYVIMGVNAIVADSDAEAQSLATTQTQFFINVVTNAQQNLQPPMANDAEVWQNFNRTENELHFGPVDLNEIPIYHQEKAVVKQMTACTLVGSPATVKAQLTQLTKQVEIDEIMAVTYIYDEQKQAKSYRLLKEIVASM